MLQDRKIGLKVPTFDDEIIMPQLAMQILDPLLIRCQLCSCQPRAATIQPAATTQLDITTSDIILQLGDILHLRDILIDSWSYWLYLSLNNC